MREGGAGWLCSQGRVCLIPLIRSRNLHQVSLRPRSGRNRLLLWGLPWPSAKGAWRLNRSSFHRWQHAGNSTSSHHPKSLPPQVCAYGLSSPLVARLVSSHGARLPCILGAVLAALGIFAASFTTSIVTFILCEHDITKGQVPPILSGYSVITGIGFGLMYIPSIVIVSR